MLINDDDFKETKKKIEKIGGIHKKNLLRRVQRTLEVTTSQCAGLNEYNEENKLWIATKSR